MEISKMQDDTKYMITKGMYKGFTVEKATEGNTSTFTVCSAKNVYEQTQKLNLTITKASGEALNENDISNGLIKLIVGDALEGYYDSLPAIPTNFWFKKMLPDLLHEELKTQSKGKNFDEAFAKLCNSMEVVRKTAKPTPYERPAAEKI